MSEPLVSDEQLAEWEQESRGLTSGLRAGHVDGLLTAIPLLVRALRDARAENKRLHSQRRHLDENGVFTLHRLAAEIYEAGFDAGARAEAERARGAARRARERQETDQ